jgi:mycoredoxin
MSAQPLQSQPRPLTVYATRLCGDCHMAKSVLDEAQVPYRWLDIDSEPGAAERVIEMNGGYRTVPTIIFPDGRVLVEPSRRELLKALGKEQLEARRGGLLRRLLGT